MQTRTATDRPRFGRRALRTSAFPLAVTMALMLAGCTGGTSPTVPAVASIPHTAGQTTSAATSRTSASAAVDAQRPQLRVDTSNAEHARLQNIWANCLHAQGVPTYQKGDGKITWIFPGAQADKYPKAWAACATKQPRGPASEDPDRNPHYADDFRNWVKCINRDSPVVKVIQTQDGWTFAKDYGENSESDAFDAVVRNCEFEAFGRG